MNDQEFVQKFRNRMAKYGWKHVPPPDCVRFIYQELGETDSILMKMGYQADNYRRHRVSPCLQSQLEEEIGQAYLMLLSLANELDLDLSHCMRRAAIAIAKRFEVEDADMPKL